MKYLIIVVCLCLMTSVGFSKHITYHAIQKENINKIYALQSSTPCADEYISNEQMYNLAILGLASTCMGMGVSIPAAIC